MRDFWQFFFVAMTCFVVMAGCGSFLPVMPPREPISFDYAPETEAAPGSADVTFVVVGAQLARPIQQTATQLLFNVNVPLFNDFANTMTNDFMEVLNARGYGVAGPFKTYSEIIHPVKEGNDLLLTAEVNFIADTKNIQIGDGYELSDGTKLYTLVGSVSVICDVKLTLFECLTNEPMWTKNVTLDPFTVAMDSTYPFYTAESLILFAIQYGKISIEKVNTYENMRTYHTRVFPNCPIGVFLERDNKFHSDLGNALKKQYKDVLRVVYTYLDPREMTIVKNQAMELRQRKVF